MRVALLLLALATLAACEGTTRESTDNGAISVSGALGGASNEGYARALAPHRFSFPRDHGPHPDFRNEWWYFTGNLTDSGGRHFGFQLTLFRIATHPEDSPRQSAWASRQLYMAHFALTDVAKDRFFAFERFARGAAGLAGAELSPFKVWLEDWKIEAKQDNAFPWRMEFQQDGIALSLAVSPEKKIVLQGDEGLSRKSAEAGNASYYYSITRLAAAGQISLNGTHHRVQGKAWLDREWSTSALANDQAGWDWFALQLEDGTDIMYYRLRRKDGGVDPYSAGVVVDGAGGETKLSAADVHIEELNYWESRGGTRYPAGWKLHIGPLNKSLVVMPVIADQELDLSVRYWEGAVTIGDPYSPAQRLGKGYVELAGYGRDDG